MFFRNKTIFRHKDFMLKNAYTFTQYSIEQHNNCIISCSNVKVKTKQIKTGTL